MSQGHHQENIFYGFIIGALVSFNIFLFRMNSELSDYAERIPVRTTTKINLAGSDQPTYGVDMHAGVCDNPTLPKQTYESRASKLLIDFCNTANTVLPPNFSSLPVAEKRAARETHAADLHHVATEIVGTDRHVRLYIEEVRYGNKSRWMWGASIRNSKNQPVL